MKTFFAALTLLFAALSAAAFASPPGMSVKNAWIAEAPPVSKVMVAYLTIENNSAEDIIIVKAESDLYSSIEFHETRHEDGMARMLRHDSLLIPANGHLILKRGGKHLMLFNPVRRLKAGDNVSINLTTKNNVKKIIHVTVKKSQY